MDKLSTDLASLGTDCISREQAIDAVNCVTVMKGIRSGKSVTAEAVDCAKRIIADNIRQLPPIQPEIVRCEECKYGDNMTDLSKVGLPRTKTYSDSTLKSWRKAELIKYIRMLEQNYDDAIFFNEQQARNVENMLKERAEME